MPMASAIAEIEDHILKKYEIRKRLGKGAYGVVWKALDRRTGEVVALKKIFDAFRNQTDAQRTFREIAFLQEFTDHPNIVKLLNVIKAENDKDIYLVFEFMETDLHNVIKRGNILKEVHKQYIMYQMLKATMYIHSGNCVHRDQKPSNVLLDSDCFVKLCDFGLARSLSQTKRQLQRPDTDPALTEYVATRWYRAPEILLASRRYTTGVDMWSLGCILGEMLLGKPLFPGSSTLNQIERIVSAISPPTKEEIASIGSNYGASILEKASSGRPARPLESILPAQVDPNAVDLLHKLLQFSPDRRITAAEALRHPYVRRFHSPTEEITLNRDVAPPVDDNSQLSVLEYRNRLYEMIQARQAARRQRRRDERRRRRRQQQQEVEGQQQNRQDDDEATVTEPLSNADYDDDVTQASVTVSAPAVAGSGASGRGLQSASTRRRSAGRASRRQQQQQQNSAAASAAALLAEARRQQSAPVAMETGGVSGDGDGGLYKPRPPLSGKRPGGYHIRRNFAAPGRVLAPAAVATGASVDSASAATTRRGAYSLTASAQQQSQRQQQQQQQQQQQPTQLLYTGGRRKWIN
uniref:mitogen-activated protein kinase n=1 Tax=Macrostomum lignano TaxID=282301 RepID=A0A1I8JIJ6_9PLAT